MHSRDEQMQALCAQQAGEWFVAHRAGTLSAGEQQAFQEWLLASPLNIEEYLGVSSIARALPQVADDPDCPLDTILSRADSERRAAAPATAAIRRPVYRSRLAASLLLVAAIGSILLWNGDRSQSWQYSTQHGGQQTVRLADNSVLHLNTDTTVSIRYGRDQRVVDIGHGQAYFVVAHDASRPFRVIAGQTDVLAVGTQFDVYRRSQSTLVTVLEGLVTVGSASAGNYRIEVSAGRQLNVTDGLLDAVATPMNAQGHVAWLKRQIAFDHEPLAAVAAEFNRYSPVAVEIESPALKAFKVSGVFSVDDMDTFVAFLKSLHGVSVESSPTRIRVTGQPTSTPARPTAVP